MSVAIRLIGSSAGGLRLLGKVATKVSNEVPALYLSGHGYGTENGDVGVLMADASPQSLGKSIAARSYADFFRDSGMLEEVVLVADCSSAIPDRSSSD